MVAPHNKSSNVQTPQHRGVSTHGERDLESEQWEMQPGAGLHVECAGAPDRLERPSAQPVGNMGGTWRNKGKKFVAVGCVYSPEHPVLLIGLINHCFPASSVSDLSVPKVF